MDIRTQIAEAHTRHFPGIEAVWTDVIGAEHPDGSLLVDMVEYHMATGGKRLRALLPVLVADALSADVERVYPFAAACEMLHNATLVHDDVQDGDSTRRGHPTVWSRFSKPQAINLGDAMYFYSLLCLDRLEVDAKRRWQICRLLIQSTTRVIDGQVQEFQLKEDPHPTPARYLAMIERKTSALFALPLVGTAVLCDASPALRGALDHAAIHLGVVFQLQDDLLDLWGEKGREQRGSDVQEGKISALVVHTLELASPEDGRRLTDLLKRGRTETTEDDVAWAIGLMKECGAQRVALDEIRQRELAISRLEALAEVPAIHRLISRLTEAFVDPISHLFAPEEVTP